MCVVAFNVTDVFSSDSSSVSHDVHLSVCLSVGLSVGQSVCQSVGLSVLDAFYAKLLVVYICCYPYCSLDY